MSGLVSVDAHDFDIEPPTSFASQSSALRAGTWQDAALHADTGNDVVVALFHSYFAFSPVICMNVQLQPALFHTHTHTHVNTHISNLDLVAQDVLSSQMRASGDEEILPAGWREGETAILAVAILEACHVR